MAKSTTSTNPWGTGARWSAYNSILTLARLSRLGRPAPLPAAAFGDAAGDRFVARPRVSEALMPWLLDYSGKVFTMPGVWLSVVWFDGSLTGDAGWSFGGQLD